PPQFLWRALLAKPFPDSALSSDGTGAPVGAQSDTDALFRHTRTEITRDKPNPNRDLQGFYENGHGVRNGGAKRAKKGVRPLFRMTSSSKKGPYPFFCFLGFSLNFPPQQDSSHRDAGTDGSEQHQITLLQAAVRHGVVQRQGNGGG